MSAGWGIAAQEAWNAGKEVGMAYLNDMFAARQLRRGYKVAKKMAIKGPSYQVQGLRRAGLNPILAAGGMKMGGSQPIPIHSARAGSVSGRATPAMDIMTARNLAAQNKLIKDQSFKTRAEGDKARAEADAIAKVGLGVTTFPGRLGDSLYRTLRNIHGRLPDDAGFWEFMSGSPTTKRPASASETRARAKRTGSSVEQRKHRMVRPTRGY